MINCKHCANPFKPRSKNQVFCQTVCKGAHMTAKKRTEREIKRAASQAVISHRIRTKERAVEYKGGCCSMCGYNKCIQALEFHHLDPESKDFAISRASKAWDTIKFELDKCIMVCANCHRELHAGCTSG